MHKPTANIDPKAASKLSPAEVILGGALTKCKDNSNSQIELEKLRILHVEDSSSDAILIENALKKEKLNFELLVVDTKENFITALKDFSPDVVLCDHSLPSFNSVEALSIFHELGMKIPFILVTARVSEEFAVEILKKGADDYIIKDRLQRLPGAILRAIETKKALYKLKENELHFRRLVETAQEGIWIVDENGCSNFVNEKMCEILEYTSGEMMGKKFIDFMDDEGKEIATGLLHRQREENVTDFEFKFISKSGEAVWAKVATNAIFENNEEYKGVLAMVSDITERKKSEIKLKSSEEFNRTILESSPDCLKVIDNEGRLQFMNINGCMLMEVDDFNSLKNKYWWDLWDDENKPIVRAAVKKALEGKPARFEAFAHTMKGTGKWWDVMVSPVSKTATGMEQIISVSRDITEKKKAGETNSFNSNLLNIIGQAAIATDIDGVITYWNRTAEHIYGWASDEVIGKNIIDITPGDATMEQALEIMEVLKKGGSWSGEFKVKRKDGSDFPAMVTNSPIYDNHNKFIGIIGISSDITEKKKLEGLLDKSNRLARIGSWEVDLVNNTNYWSDITREIHEVSPDFIPDLATGINFYKAGSSREAITKLVKDAIDNNTPFDMELQIITAKDNERWVRAIGEVECIDGKGVKLFGSFQDIDKLKMAEMKIRESEFRYRQIVETAQEGIWMVDENNNTTFVNKKMCEIIGYTSDEMIGKSKFDFKDEEGLKIAVESLNRKRQGIIESYKSSFITKDGRLIWTQISSNPIFDEKKEYQGSLFMVSDITDKLKADKMLEESEHKFRIIAFELEKEKSRLLKAQEVSKVGSWETDLQTLQIIWSKETHRIFGTDPESFKATHADFLSFIHPEDKEKVDAAFGASLSNTGSNCMEHRIITKQGVEKFLEEKWSISFDENGVPLQALGTCQDITDRKKAAEKIISSEEKLKAAQAVAHVGSWEVDMVTREVYWSDEYRRILGINTDVLSFEVLLSHIHPDDSEYVKSNIENAFSTLKDSSFNFRFINSTGDVGYARSEYKFDFDIHNKPLRINGILRDITEQKKAEIEREKLTTDLIQRNKDLEQFSYIISHNLRAPVANIIGITAELNEDSHSSEVKKILKQELTSSVKNLDDVIIDLNTILNAKREITEIKEEVIFSELVNNIKSSIKTIILEQRVQIKTDFTEAGEFNTLRTYLHSIFYNLISNSIKYQQPGVAPLIEITSKKCNGKLVLIFADNGRGIDLVKKKDLVFGLYKRFHTNIEGKGMGLFMVKSQVETLGGKIAVSSEVNKGTVFTIEFEI